MFSRSRCEGILSGRRDRLTVGVNESQTVTPTGGNEDDLLLNGVVLLYSVVQSSRQDPKLTMVKRFWL